MQALLHVTYEAQVTAGKKQYWEAFGLTQDQADALCETCQRAPRLTRRVRGLAALPMKGDTGGDDTPTTGAAAPGQ